MFKKLIALVILVTTVHAACESASDSIVYTKTSDKVEVKYDSSSTPTTRVFTDFKIAADCSGIAKCALYYDDKSTKFTSENFNVALSAEGVIIWTLKTNVAEGYSEKARLFCAGNDMFVGGYSDLLTFT